MSSSLLFAYGTLQSEFSTDISSRISKGLVPCGAARFQGRLFEIEGYPGAMHCDDESRWVCGQLFEVLDEALWLLMDDYEECSASFPPPHEYARELVTVFTLQGEVRKAWVYLYKHPLNDRLEIESGNYLEFYKQHYYKK